MLSKLGALRHRNVFFCALLLGLVAPAAHGDDFSGNIYAGVERADILTTDDESSGSTSQLEEAFVGQAVGRYRHKIDRNQRLTAEVNFRSERFFNIGERSTERIRSRVEYRRWIDGDRNTYLRSRLSHEYKIRGGDFLRHKFASQFGVFHRFRNRHTVFLNFHGRRQEFNDQRTFGFDQWEFRAETGVYLKTGGSRGRVSVVGYYEQAFADANRFDYVSGGGRVRVAQPLTEKVDFVAEAGGRLREFGAPFATRDPQVRIDREYYVLAGARYNISDDLALTAQGGWQENAASVDERRFSGFIFRLGSHFRF